MRDVADFVSTASLAKRETLQVFAIKPIEEEGDPSPDELADTVVCDEGCGICQCIPCCRSRFDDTCDLACNHSSVPTQKLQMCTVAL
jgi:hypothetical protein